MPTESPKKCFILMPFKDDLKEVYDQAIRPACTAAGFESLRVDELIGVYNINRKIIENIFESDAIIVDLTNWNPNVFYEMGVAHAIDNKTIMISQRKDKPPFDVSTYTCILYDQTPAGLKELHQKIVVFLKSIHEWCGHPTNPVQDFKPFEALIPRRELETVKDQLHETENLLKDMVPQAEVEILQKQLLDLNVQISTLKKIIECNPYLQVLRDEVDKLKVTESKIITPHGMVLIPAGEFLMGTSDEQFQRYTRENHAWKVFLERERPEHKIYLDAFFIDQYPVTNVQYAEFLNTRGKDTDEADKQMIEEHEWGVRKVKDRWESQPGFENHPVVGVTWFGAHQYAQWAQKQLPTEAQWEKAARGSRALEYATRNGLISHDLANYDGKVGKTTPVGYYPQNPFQLFDMSGNVLEWCRDWFGEKYYQIGVKSGVMKNPTGLEKGTARVLRGGSWDLHPIYLRTANRLRYDPTYRGKDVGFRCSRASI